MQNKQEDKKVKAEQVKVNGRNVHEVITQIVEKFNSSNGWAVKKVNMKMLNNLEVYLERSEKQAEDDKPVETTQKAKAVSDVKTEEKVTEKDTAPEKQSEDKVDDSADSKPKTTAKRTTSRAKK